MTRRQPRREHPTAAAVPPARRLLARAAAALAASAVVVAATMAPAPASVMRVPAPDYSVNPAIHLAEYENRIVARINVVRARAGLRQLRFYQTCLDARAERWANHLAEIGRLEHRSGTRVIDACDLRWTGETLARGTRNLRPRGMVRTWMHSPGHRAVLMKPRANLAGVAVRRDSQGRLVGVVNLGDAT